MEDKLRYFLKRVTANLHETRQRLHEVETASGEPIAIIGMGCRFPGEVHSPEDLWELLANGTDAVAALPQDRGWDLGDPDDPDTGGARVRSGGFLYDATGFDAGFFGISPREALTMDPQQRLLLEVAWEALERSTIDPASLRGTSTGVFAGASASGYAWMSSKQGEHDGHTMTGNATSILSGRVSYTLGLEGPAVTVDTACSSALVALHLAVQSLRGGECSLALVGGAFVAATPVLFTDFNESLGLSPDGRCKTFAESADGMGVAEGVGVLVVERLSEARRNGHKILAVVRGSAVNQDGASNGLTAPNGPSQQRVIRAALAGAKLSASDVDVVEAHGTGTPLGDPIEAQALLATYGRERGDQPPLWLGSVKSNIGHAQQAAGMAGVIKMVLALQNEKLPATLHADQPTSHVDWSAGEVRLLQDPVAWPAGERVRRAGVSGFGMSGTNVHVILEEAPTAVAAEESPAEDDDGLAEAVADADGTGEAASEPARLPVLRAGDVSAWPVSARSAASLERQVERLRAWVAAHPGTAPGDVGWSLAASRSVFEYRAVTVGDSPLSGVARTGVRPVFVFAGQGSQWAGMGRQLLAESPVFAAKLAECERALTPLVDWSLSEKLTSAATLDTADVVQPVLWAVMVSLAAVWEASGVTPQAVVGHSQGEIAAATVAGLLSVEDAARVVVARSRALSSLSVSGSMVSVVMPSAAVEELVERWDGRLSVAAINGPATVVVSGEPDALEEFERELARQHVLRWRVPETDFVAHSPVVEPLESVLAAELAGITVLPGRVPMVSTVTGDWLGDTPVDAAYWYANLRRMVRFEQAVRVLVEAGHTAFVEVSPHPVLTAAIEETAEGVSTVGTLERDHDDTARVLKSLGQAWVAGLPVDWKAVLPAGELVDLPTYAFDHHRYWLEPATDSPDTAGSGLGTVAEARFWAAVEGGDRAHIAEVLEIEDQHHLDEVLPALASWRRREQDRSLTANWRYRVTWTPVPEPRTTALTGTWLVIAAAGQGRPDVTAALEARGADVVAIELPADRDRITTELYDLGTDVGDVTGIVTLLALDESPLPEFPAVSQGLAATLAVLQTFDQIGLDAPRWVLTCGAVATAPGDPLPSPTQAQAWGLGRVVGLENPDRWGGLIDLPAVLDAKAAARLAAVLAGTGEDQVAIRPSGIIGRRLTQAPRPRNAAERWTPRGSTLITGGTGAIGGHVARWLAERGAPRLVLTSRSGPAAAGVPALAAQLATAGARVDVLAGDAGIRPDLAAVLSRIDATGPQLSAVMHTAGIGPTAPVAGTTPELLAAVLGAKATAAAHLHELTRDRDLDAFVLFSSISATWGSGLQSAYAAANTYLDALAEHRRGLGLPATSVAWGPWGGGGMTDAEGAAQGVRRGLMTMEPRHAVRALAQILDAGEGQVTIADVDWNRFAPPFTLRRPSPLIADLPAVKRVLDSGPAAPGAEADGGSDLKRQLAGLSRADRLRTLVGLVQSHAAAVLDYPSPDAVDAHRAFSDLGFDSLTAVQLRNRLSGAADLQLPATLLFDAPTPTAAAEFLLAQLGDAPGAAPAAPIAAAVSDEPIAIVGMACRYPGGSDSPDDLWKVVAAGTDAIAALPENRGWRLQDLSDPGYAGDAVRSGGFVYDADGFDAGFFGISPREALTMDPQQRLLLEVAWEALERAGIDPASMHGSATGVFAGASASGYGWSAGLQGRLDGHLVTGISTSVVSGRVSYTLGLEGPAVTVDTACSSSLVALHLATQALRSGECTTALAGGVMVAANPLLFDQFSRQMGLAPDGRCKPFSASADGMGLGEGAGMLVLERLSDAQRNGHRILAIVRGSAVNQDGASNGLTAPNGPSQQRVIRAALASAQLSASDVDVVEAHGTGTVLGDPIEAQALLATYGQERGDQPPLWLGSLKSNIGHTQAAAGVAGVIKMVLALQNQQIPATLHAGEPSPHIDWSAGDVRLLQEPVPWPAGERVRRAGISSFGMSGTNVHLILEEAPAESPATPDRDPAGPPVVQSAAVCAWPVSARSAVSLAGQAGRLREWVAAHPGAVPGDVGWSLAVSRSVFEHRAVVFGEDRPALIDGLGTLATAGSAAGVVSGVSGTGVRPVFVFAGQGSQWVGMGRRLLAESPVFAARLAECERALAPLVDWSLSEKLSSGDSLDTADVVQPVLWAVMVSLAAVWEASGVTPQAVVGHSQGEIAAATVAGLLSVEDAARVVVARSRALSSLSVSGSMVSVVMPSAAVEELVRQWDGRLSVAAVNGPATVVVSGEQEALAEFERTLARQRVLRWRVPETDFVAHSPLVEPLEAVLAAELADIAVLPGRVPMLSTVTGDWLGDTPVDAAYWYANLRRMVRFEQAVRVLVGAGHTAFVEVSPHPVLTAAIEETAEGVSTVGTLERDHDDAARVLKSLAQAWVSGLPVDWKAVLPAGELVDLPTYAFQHQPYWLEPTPTADTPSDGAAVDTEFWAAIENADLSRLGDTLAIDTARPIADLLPALASWRRREQDRSLTAGWRYRATWTPVPDTGAGALTGAWLVLRPEGTRTDVADALAARGAEVTVVDVPAGVTGSAELNSLLTGALPDNAVTAGVVSLLGLDETAVPGTPVVSRGLAATLGLTQALGDAGIDAPLWVLTCGAVAAGPGETLTSPVQAQLWGLGRVIALEYPERWGGLVDVPAVLDERAGGRLVSVLADRGEDQAAIRTTAVLGRRLAHLPAPRTPAGPWTPRGSTLVTGGTGAIAGHVAHWLAERGAPRVVLTSRTGAAADGVPARAARLATEGTRVDVVTCDIGDRAALSGLLDWIDTGGPELSTVLHTAGIGPAAAVSDTTTGDLSRILAAKAAGATHLHELTRDRDLDAFVLFSSISATWGSGLQSAYAAANTYLDALAEHRRGLGLPATSVAWGPWGGGGMTDEQGAAQGARRGLSVMQPDQAVQALAQIVDAGEGLVTIADVDWDRFAPPFTLRRPSPLIGDLPAVKQALAAAEPAAAEANPDAGAALRQRLAGQPKVEQQRMLVSLVQAQAAGVLDYPSPDLVEATRAFSDLGFDSLTAVELRNRISAATDLQLPATLLFDCPNPTALADYLWHQLFQGELMPVSLVQEVDRLGSLLADAKPDSDTIPLILERLQGLVAQWTASTTSTKHEVVAEKIGAATDDEIFDFIHRELGR
ncbi:type I polyketide synthase [Krasilnikovia sp. MM14-A1259]|uniref:type I polyketide synthase n=1 Tax=Krasilnikovia sp. MM14-A1259 TaxID=3373539 RepID=UPI0037F94A3D